MGIYFIYSIIGTMDLLGLILRLIERIITFIIRVDDKDLYGLDHAILNVTVPPKSMWMNMGYWQVCMEQDSNNFFFFSISTYIYIYMYTYMYLDLLLKIRKTKPLAYECLQ
jgi:hypothetical protein